MFVCCCFLSFVVCGVRFAPLFVASCLVFAVRVCCRLFGVRCLLFVVVRCSLCVGRGSLFDVRCLLFVACC